MSSPLQQFEIKPLIPINLGGFDISYSNSSLFMTLALLAATALFMLATRSQAIIPTRWQGVAEGYYKFVESLVVDAGSREALKYFPFIFGLFTFVLFANLLGMLPFAFTVTSHIAVTLALAMIVFVMVTVIGFMKHGLHFFSLFLPEGTPWPVALVLVPIEVFSYMMRPMTLSVRLFANMMAGHVLLKVIAGLCVIAMPVLAVLPFGLTVVLTGFELFVACLQAYIFALLSCVYLKDAIHLH